MGNASDSDRTGGRSHEVAVVAVLPFVAAGVVAVAAALAASLTQPGKRAGAAGERRQSLIAYLRDHLSGADTALLVVRRLAAADEDAPDAHLFRYLVSEFEADHATVRSLLARLGGSARSPKRTAGRASGLVVSLAAGGAPGDLSLFRTLESVSIGIQGKRCMWRTLQELSIPSDRQIFAELEARALRQWEAVEARRRTLATTTFPILAGLPGYFQGVMSLGGLMQGAQAFQQLAAALTWPVTSMERVATWGASAERVLALQAALVGQEKPLPAALPVPAE